MGQYPLPALDVQPTQSDPISAYAKIQGIKSMQNQQALQQQQLANEKLTNQSGQVQLQQQQLQLQDQQKVRQAFMDSQGDMDKFYDNATKSGVSPQTLMGLKNGILEQKQKLATLSKDQLANTKAQNDMVGQATGAVLGLPPEQRQQALLTNVIPNLVKQGVMQPQEAQQYSQQIQQSDPASLEQMLKLHQFSAIAADKQISTLLEQQKGADEHSAAVAKLPGQQAESQIKQNELSYGPTGPAADARYRFVLQKIQKGQTVAPDDMAFAKSYEASNTKTSTSSDSLGIKSTSVNGPSGIAAISGRVASGGSGGGGGTNLTPAGNTLVDEIGQGKMVISRMDQILTKRPELAQAVAQKYPDFDSSKVKSYQGTYESFTHGADAKQVTAGAVAIRHLDELNKLNEDHTAAVRIPGTDAYNRFHNLLDTVADELVTFYGEPKTNEAMASKKATLGALLNRSGAIQEQAKAMGVKFDELEQKWNNAAPSKAYQAPMPGMSDAAKESRARLDPEYAQKVQSEKSSATSQKGGGNSFSVTDPRGVVHTFPNQQAADSFKKAIGQ